jgi:hypothetical protein
MKQELNSTNVSIYLICYLSFAHPDNIKPNQVKSAFHFYKYPTLRLPLVLSRSPKSFDVA